MYYLCADKSMYIARFNRFFVVKVYYSMDGGRNWHDEPNMIGGFSSKYKASKLTLEQASRIYNIFSEQYKPFPKYINMRIESVNNDQRNQNNSDSVNVVDSNVDIV